MCEQERRMCISQQEFLGISELGGGFMKVKSGFKLMKVGVQNLVVAWMRGRRSSTEWSA